MSIVIKNKKKSPHLALTHNELQGGAANGRNLSLLMKSDVEITEDVAALIEKVSGLKVEVNKASYATIREKLREEIKKFETKDYDWSYVEDFDGNNVVFSNNDGLFYASYSISGLDVSVGDEAIEVSRVVNYVEGDDKIVMNDSLKSIDSGVQSLIVKSFDSISKNEKLVDVFKSKLEKGVKMEEVQKAVDAATAILKADLEKSQASLKEAQDQIESFQKSLKEQKEAGRKTAIDEVVKDADKASELLKATATLDDDSFQVILKSFKEKADMIEGSDLFTTTSQKTDISKADEVPGHIQILKKQYKIED